MVIEPQLTQEKPTSGDGPLKLTVAAGENDVQPSSEDGDRRAICFQCGAMRRAVDTRREAAHDAGARSNECVRQLARDALAVRGGPPRSDDRDAGQNGKRLERSTRPEI